MKLQKYLLILGVILFSVSQPIIAKIYQIPKPLLQDVVANEAVFNTNPDSADARFELAMSYAYTGQIEKGWDMLKSIPKYDDNYAPKVIGKYGALAEKEPENWKHKFKLAFGYYFIKQKDRAIQEFNKILEIDPNHIWAMGFIGLLKGEQKDYEGAIEACKQALKIEPNATAIHFLLGEAYRQKGEQLKFLQQMLIVGRLKTEERIAQERSK